MIGMPSRRSRALWSVAARADARCSTCHRHRPAVDPGAEAGRIGDVAVEILGEVVVGKREGDGDAHVAAARGCGTRSAPAPRRPRRRGPRRPCRCRALCLRTRPPAPRSATLSLASGRPSRSQRRQGEGAGARDSSNPPRPTASGQDIEIAVRPPVAPAHLEPGRADPAHVLAAEADQVFRLCPCRRPAGTRRSASASRRRW